MYCLGCANTSKVHSSLPHSRADSPVAVLNYSSGAKLPNED